MITSDRARAAAREYLRQIDGDDFGSKDGHDIEELEEIIEKAMKSSQDALKSLQNTVWKSMDDYSKQLGWGLTGIQPECWCCLDAAVKELVEWRKVITSLWQIVVENPGEEPYTIGGTHADLKSAKWYRDECLEPRRGKRRGFRKKTVFRIYRIDTVRTEEK